MVIYPAIDLYGGKAVRLFKGDYAQMTVYSDDPVGVAKDFAAAGASHIHLVDLEGAKIGRPAHLDTIRAIVEAIFAASFKQQLHSQADAEQGLACRRLGLDKIRQAGGP